MTRWNPWRSLLAGAVLGFVEAAGSEAERRRLHHPSPIVWFSDGARLPGRPRGLWFLAPLGGWQRFLHRN